MVNLDFSGIKSPSFTRLKPMGNITPFTYQDGATYLEILRKLETYIKSDLVPDVDSNLDKFVKQLNEFIVDVESGLAVDRAALEAIYAEFVSNVSTEVDFINNKTGAADIERVELTQDYTVTINPVWPTNQPVRFVLTQDSSGGHSVNLGSDITGILNLNTEPNSETIFTLFPDGDSGWVIFQTPNTETELQNFISAATGPKLENLEGRVTTLVADTVDTLTNRVLDVETNTASAVQQLQDTRAAVWKPETDYAAGDLVLTPSGDAVQAFRDHTSGAAYSPDEWLGDFGYLFANFTYNSPEGEKLNLFYSPDGKTVTGEGPNPIYSPATGLRDPSIIKQGNRWVMVHGHSVPENKKISLAYSYNLLDWVFLRDIDLSNTSGITRAWAPELIVLDNEVYIFYTSVVSPTSHEAWFIKAQDSTLTVWGQPQKVSWSSQPGKVMDPVMDERNGTWYMFYGDNNYICRATASNPMGPWTQDKNGDWAAWGINKEAPQLVRIAPGKWRMYIDRYEGASPNWTYPGYAYTESTDLNTWSALTPLSMGNSGRDIKLRHGSFIKLDNAADASIVQGVISASGSVQRYIEATAGATSIPANGIETSCGNLVIDNERNLKSSDYTIINPGKIKIGTTGVYSVNFQVKGLGENEKWWLTIGSPTRGYSIARNVGNGGFEANVSHPGIRLNAGDIVEFIIGQFGTAAKSVTSRVQIMKIR